MFPIPLVENQPKKVNNPPPCLILSWYSVLRQASSLLVDNRLFCRSCMTQVCKDVVKTISCFMAIYILLPEVYTKFLCFPHRVAHK